MFAPALGIPAEFHRRNLCRLRLKQVYRALEAYANDHQGEFPDGLWQLWDNGYVHSGRVFLCPSVHSTDSVRAKNSQELRSGMGRDYVYFPPSAVHRNGVSYVLVMDKPPNHSGYGLALYNDGKIRAFVGETWWSRIGSQPE